MVQHAELNGQQVLKFIRTGQIILGGNKRLKIFGMLKCKSGKRMTKENRVFFQTKEEAIAHGYRPCGHCLHKEYVIWKTSEK